YGDHRDLHSFPTRRSSDLGYDIDAAASSSAVVHPNVARRSRWAASPAEVVSGLAQAPAAPAAEAATREPPGSCRVRYRKPTAPTTPPAAIPRTWRRLSFRFALPIAGQFRQPT